MLTFTSKDPDKGYLGTNLLLPRRHINEHPLKMALTFLLPEMEKVIDPLTHEVLKEKNKELKLWDETGNHLIVPREFYHPDTLAQVRQSFEIVDETQRDFPRAGIKAKSKPFDHQLEPMQKMIESGGGTLNLRCGGGKTVITLLVAAELDVPMLVVVNNGALMTQWYEEICKHLSVESVGRIQADRLDWVGRPIVISMIHTLAARPELRCAEFRDRFGLAVYDEGHHMSAPVFVKGADLVIGRRYGLTATAERTDGLESVYQAHLGRVFHRDLVQELIPRTVFHALKWSVPVNDEQYVKDRSGVVNMNLLRGYLGTLDWRNDFINDNIRRDLEAGRNILVLSHSVDHVKELASISPSDNAGMIIGEVDQDYRFDILRNRNPVYGTFVLAREGLDKPELDTIHICTPFSNSNDLQQAWGRAQREHEGKKQPVVHVYEDAGVQQCLAACQKLRKYLKALQYPVSRKIDVRR